MKTQEDMVKLYLEYLKYDQELLKRVIEKDPLYPKEDVPSILQRIQKHYDSLQSIRTKSRDKFLPGTWIQIFDGDSYNPLYAKVEGTHPEDEEYITCKGMYTTNTEGKLRKKAFKKSLCLPVSDEVGRGLEFCNSLNLLKPEEHTRGL